MKYRAIDDDLSRGPFPTLEFQKHQVRIFAALKANIYSPYFEHTLQYPNQPLAAAPGSAMTPADVAELVRYAAQYHVTILPEQEAFGHLHHVLKYDLYAEAAETPHGQVLAPGQPQSLALIHDWFAQIAREFPSPFMHIGADETDDLGRGRTKDAVKQRGYGPVYVDFLTQIHDVLAPLHKRLLFWGDIGGGRSGGGFKTTERHDRRALELLGHQRLRQDDRALRQGGDRDLGGSRRCELEPGLSGRQCGLRQYSGIHPRWSAARSTGALTTVWNDDGEGLFNQDWYGVLFGAVAAWQPGESSIPAYQAAYGPVFHGDGSGKINAAEEELMLANQTLGKAKTDFSSDDLFWLDPWSAEGGRSA